MRANGVRSEKICEVELSPKWYAEISKETPACGRLSREADFLNRNETLAVLFDMVSGNCVMKKTNQFKMNKQIDSPQFFRI